MKHSIKLSLLGLIFVVFVVFLLFLPFQLLLWGMVGLVIFLELFTSNWRVKDLLFRAHGILSKPLKMVTYIGFLLAIVVFGIRFSSSYFPDTSSFREKAREMMIEEHTERYRQVFKSQIEILDMIFGRSFHLRYLALEKLQSDSARSAISKAGEAAVSIDDENLYIMEYIFVANGYMWSLLAMLFCWIPFILYLKHENIMKTMESMQPEEPVRFIPIGAQEFYKILMLHQPAFGIGIILNFTFTVMPAILILPAAHSFIAWLVSHGWDFFHFRTIFPLWNSAIWRVPGIVLINIWIASLLVWVAPFIYGVLNIEKMLEEELQRSLTERVRRMSDHVIVLGYGNLGKKIVRQIIPKDDKKKEKKHRQFLSVGLTDVHPTIITLITSKTRIIEVHNTLVVVDRSHTRFQYYYQDSFFGGIGLLPIDDDGDTETHDHHDEVATTVTRTEKTPRYCIGICGQIEDNALLGRINIASAALTIDAISGDFANELIVTNAHRYGNPTIVCLTSTLYLTAFYQPSMHKTDYPGLFPAGPGTGDEKLSTRLFFLSPALARGRAMGLRIFAAYKAIHDNLDKYKKKHFRELETRPNILIIGSGMDIHFAVEAIWGALPRKERKAFIEQKIHLFTNDEEHIGPNLVMQEKPTAVAGYPPVDGYWPQIFDEDPRARDIKIHTYFGDIFFRLGLEHVLDDVNPALIFIMPSNDADLLLRLTSRTLIALKCIKRDANTNFIYMPQVLLAAGNDSQMRFARNIIASGYAPIHSKWVNNGVTSDKEPYRLEEWRKCLALPNAVSDLFWEDTSGEEQYIVNPIFQIQKSLFPEDEDRGEENSPAGESKGMDGRAKNLVKTITKHLSVADRKEPERADFEEIFLRIQLCTYNVPGSLASIARHLGVTTYIKDLQIVQKSRLYMFNANVFRDKEENYHFTTYAYLLENTAVSRMLTRLPGPETAPHADGNKNKKERPYEWDGILRSVLISPMRKSDVKLFKRDRVKSHGKIGFAPLLERWPFWTSIREDTKWVTDPAVDRYCLSKTLCPIISYAKLNKRCRECYATLKMDHDYLLPEIDSFHAPMAKITVEIDESAHKAGVLGFLTGLLSGHQYDLRKPDPGKLQFACNYLSDSQCSRMDLRLITLYGELTDGNTFSEIKTSIINKCIITPITNNEAWQLYYRDLQSWVKQLNNLVGKPIVMDLDTTIRLNV
ncbi:hypothetical protein JW905_05050 [bacterium]|nr:hypothetical protein [candidate division CSSED10-310 bacterium]